jgi:hypothetical protein
MNKSNLTKIELENAISRIQSGETIRISPSQRLSVRAVEIEAGLGDGSAYYYRDIVNEIKTIINNKSIAESGVKSTDSDNILLREKLNKEIQLKKKYRAEVGNLKERLSLMAKTHNELSVEVVMHKKRIEDLEGQLVLANHNKKTNRN